MDWSGGGSRVSFLQTQLFPVCQTLAAKGTKSTILTKMRVDIITMKRAFICMQQQADFVVNEKINLLTTKSIGGES